MERTLLITGANRGLGLALTRQFARENWNVLACCRTPDSARELQAEAARNESIEIFQLDVTDQGQIKALARRLKGQKIDILFNNAGIHGPKPQGFGPIEHEGWLEAFRVNVMGPFDMAVAFADQVAASEMKTLAIMGTMLGSISDNSSGGKYVYRSSKAAVHMVGKSLSVDLREQGIVTVMLHPGWVRTDLGGDSAPMNPGESAKKLWQVLMQVKPSDNGKLIGHDGREIPW